MSTLPELTEQLRKVDTELQQFIDTLDLDEDVDVQLKEFTDKYFLSVDAFKDKVNSWGWVIIRLNAQAEYNRYQAQRFAKLASTNEKLADNMKQYLLQTIEGQGGKVNTRDFKLSVRFTNEKVVIDNNYSGDIPEEFLRALDVEDLVDKNAVKRSLKEGRELSFAKLSEKGKCLFGLK